MVNPATRNVDHHIIIISHARSCSFGRRKNGYLYANEYRVRIEYTGTEKNDINMISTIYVLV